MQPPKNKSQRSSDEPTAGKRARLLIGGSCADRSAMWNTAHELRVGTAIANCAQGDSQQMRSLARDAPLETHLCTRHRPGPSKSHSHSSDTLCQSAHSLRSAVTASPDSTKDTPTRVTLDATDLVLIANKRTVRDGCGLYQGEALRDTAGQLVDAIAVAQIGLNASTCTRNRHEGDHKSAPSSYHSTYH